MNPIDCNNTKPCTKTTIKSIVDTIQHIYYLGKFFGLAPFSLQHHQNVFNWKLLIIDIVIFLLHIVIQFIYYYLIFQVALMPSTGLPIADVGIATTARYFILYRLIVSISFVIIRKKIRLNIIQEIFVQDIEMKKLGININHKRHRNFVFFYTIFILLSSAICVLSTASIIIYFEIIYYTIAERFLMVALFFYTSVTYAMIKSYYFLALLAIRTRISAINQFLRPYDRDFQDVRQNKCRIMHCHTNETIKQISIIYDKCTEIVDSINYCFALPVLGMTITFFAFNVFCTFVFCRALFRRSLTINQIVLDVVMNALWNTYYFTFMFLVIYSGATLHKEAKHTGVMVHRLVNSVDSNEKLLIKQLELFSHQLHHRTPVATCGLFPFDWTLLYSIFAATATYIVILMQFDTPDLNQPPPNSTEYLRQRNY